MNPEAFALWCMSIGGQCRMATGADPRMSAEAFRSLIAWVHQGRPVACAGCGLSHRTATSVGFYHKSGDGRAFIWLPCEFCGARLGEPELNVYVERHFEEWTSNGDVPGAVAVVQMPSGPWHRGQCMN